MARGDKKGPSFEGNVAREASKVDAQGRDPARDSALARAVQQIEKQFGKGAVMKLDEHTRAAVDGIPTGIAVARHRLGRGRGSQAAGCWRVFGP